MSSKYPVDDFDDKHTIYANCPWLGMYNNVVELLERLNSNSSIWVVRIVETDEIILMEESKLENPFYWGD